MMVILYYKQTIEHQKKHQDAYIKMLNKSKGPEQAGTELIEDKKGEENNAAQDKDNLWKRSTVPNFFKEVPVWDLFLEKVATT